MTLATRLRVMVVALAIAPILLLMLSFAVVLGVSRDEQRAVAAFEIHRWVEDAVIRSLEAGRRPEVPPPPGAWAIAIGPDNRVIYSTIDAIPAGAFVNPSQDPDRVRGVVEAQIGGSPGADFGAAIRLVDRADGTLVRVAHVVRRPPRGPLSETRRVIALASAVVAVLMLASIAGTLVMRTLRDRMAVIQGGIRQIAAGDLARPLVAARRDEFGVLVGQLDAMRSTLLENRERRSRFLMAVSHDLGTPLTTINGYLEAILDGVVAGDDAVRDAARAMRAKADLLHERIDELIEFVRLESGEWRLRKREVDLVSYLDSVCRTFTRDAEAIGKRFTCDVRVAPGLSLTADTRLLDRAFENLFHNAVRYTGDDGLITLTARDDPASGHRRGADGGGAPHEVTVNVEDNGPGFGDLSPEELFEPFRRGSAARNEAGFGLGLSTVRSVLRAHGYEITADERAGGGARFAVHLTARMRSERKVPNE